MCGTLATGLSHITSLGAGCGGALSSTPDTPASEPDEACEQITDVCGELWGRASRAHGPPSPTRITRPPHFEVDLLFPSLMLWPIKELTQGCLPRYVHSGEESIV